MGNVGARDQSRYEIVFVCGDEDLPPHEWPVSGRIPESMRVYRNGVPLGLVAAESGDGWFEAESGGRFQVRYAWIGDDEVTSFGRRAAAPGDDRVGPVARA